MEAWRKVKVWLGKLLLQAPTSRGGSALASDGMRTELDWKSAFHDAGVLERAPLEIELAQRRMTQHLGRFYEAHDRLTRQQAQILQRLVELLDFCDGLKSPSTDAQAVRAELLKLLGDFRITAWGPELGKPLTEQCEVLGKCPTQDFAPGTVCRVVLPGYKSSEGSVLRYPRVLLAEVATAPPQVKPHPEHVRSAPKQEHKLSSESTLPVSNEPIVQRTIEDGGSHVHGDRN